MKLEIGQFVRVKGHIGKIANINEFREPDLEVAIDIPHFNDLVFVNRNDITKASYDIKKLIEVGDYINGSRVVKINCNLEYVDDDADTGVNKVDDGIETEKEFIYFDSEIETVLTKEQFENNCYKKAGDK